MKNKKLPKKRELINKTAVKPQNQYKDMEKKEITLDMVEKLKAPLPREAIKQHPTKSFLSTIKAIYVTERLSDVFGVGSFKITSEIIEKTDKGMVVVKAKLSIPDYGIELESYGGNDNGGENSKGFDLGDAYKGAVTDAITKMGSWLYIGIDVFKGKGSTQAQYRQPAPPKQAEQHNPDLVLAIDEASKATTIPLLNAVWDNWSAFHSNGGFKNAVTRRKKELIDPKNQ